MRVCEAIVTRLWLDCNGFPGQGTKSDVIWKTLGCDQAFASQKLLGLLVLFR